MSDLIHFDKIIFSPNDIREDYKSLSNDLGQETEILGTFNPGMAKLPNGNLLLMIRVAEALKEWNTEEYILTPRFDAKLEKYVIDKYSKENIILREPRLFVQKQQNNTLALGLTSISWLLPVEISPDASRIINIHYDQIIVPKRKLEEMGIEDPRITLINDVYYMTIVAVSSNRICTCLYKSKDGLSYGYMDIIFEHQNKDVVLFPDKINGQYHTLTRPEGNNTSIGFPPQEKYLAGPFINVATSLDLLYWKPIEDVLKLLEKQSFYTSRIGPGAPPITHYLNGKLYYLELFHGVEHQGANEVGKYRTFAMLINKDNPTEINAISREPVLQYNEDLKDQIHGKLLIEEDVVFTTGITTYNEDYIIASGELDTATRLTRVSQDYINSFLK